MKREAELKAAFMRELSRQCPQFIVLHYLSAGAPDREIVGHGITTRWEMKHCTPGYISHGIQELICMRLAVEGHCRYILWKENGEERQTLIVHPKDVHFKTGVVEASCDGFNHTWLVDYVRKEHGL